MNVIPEVYGGIYVRAVEKIIPEAENLMMVLDEVVAQSGNFATIVNERVCIIVRRSTKAEADMYLKCVGDTK